MIHDALIIYRKELKNILKDRRTLFATLVIPLLLIPLLFTGMDFMAKRQRSEAVGTVYKVVILNNEDAAFQEILSSYLKIEQVSSDAGSLEGVMTIAFPEGYIVGDKAEVQVTFDSTSQKSVYAASAASSAIVSYSTELAADYLQTYGIELKELYTLKANQIDTASEQAQNAGFLLIMLPYLILIYVFAGAMSVGMDSTAGEKERGSLAVILVNQVSRSSIALGKVFYVVSVGIASSFMTFLGFIAAMKLTGGLFGSSGDMSTMTVSSLGYLLLTLVITSTLAASIIVFLGSLARTMKEAATYIMPIYFIVIIVGVITMNIDPGTNKMLFLVPFLNSIFMLKSAIIGEGSLMNLLLLLLSNGVLITLFLGGTAKLYNSEKILNTIS